MEPKILPGLSNRGKRQLANLFRFIGKLSTTVEEHAAKGPLTGNAFLFVDKAKPECQPIVPADGQTFRDRILTQCRTVPALAIIHTGEAELPTKPGSEGVQALFWRAEPAKDDDDCLVILSAQFRLQNRAMISVVLRRLHRLPDGTGKMGEPVVETSGSETGLHHVLVNIT